MNTKTLFTFKIKQLLKSNTVMTLQQIRHELNERPRSSLFRDLKKMELLTSYSHAGQYHALKSAVKFDVNGLWFFDEACFSKYGTLKNTITKTISNAPAGMTHKELKNLLRIKVQNTLTNLVKSNTVTRQLLSKQIYVYLSANTLDAKAQVKKRLAINERTPDITLPPQSVRIEILIEIIRSTNHIMDEKELGILLRTRGVAVNDTAIAYVLTYYDIKKKTDYEIIKLIRAKIDQLCMSIQAGYLFYETPQVNFYPTNNKCNCGTDLSIFKTSRKIIATLDIGEFEAIETHKFCKHCKQTYSSDELRTLTPQRSKFGFDVIEYIGKALFIQCRSELEIQAKLAIRNISISPSEINFLGKRFIVYLMLAHKECNDQLKQYMYSKGGYILHMDGTCEGNSPHLFSCIDEISNIILGNKKMPTEDSQHIIPYRLSLKAAYGNPIAIVHDMGSAIIKAVFEVFPDIANYICHFHFLRDIGKDMFDFEYRAIQRHIRTYNIRAKLNKVSKQLKAIISADPQLLDSLECYLKSDTTKNPENSLEPEVMAYSLVSWILESSCASNGFGFPFDRPHLEFYLRLQEAYPVLKLLNEKGVLLLPVNILNRILKDCALKKRVSHIQDKILIFEELRASMRIACPSTQQGLNDEGFDAIKTIESRVKKFRNSAKIVALASRSDSYHKMVKQIDKYWDKLFADPIIVETPTGKITVQPQRTNNLMEQSFRG